MISISPYANLVVNLQNTIFSMQTTALKSGALRHDIHYWLGKDTSQVSYCHIVLVHVQFSISRIWIFIWWPQHCQIRMKLVRQPSRRLNLMQLLEDVLFSIVKYRAMKPKSFYPILNRVLYLKKVEFLQDSSMLRLKNTRRGYMFAKENMLFM